MLERSAPLIIVKNTQAENICNLKCSYQFDYAPTNLQIMNRGEYLVWKVAETSIPPVTYNDDLYDVLEARIYWKSLHGYSNDSTGEPLYADAELIIEHVNRKNTKRLMVCVPITKSSTTTADSAMFFDFIMTEISRTAPSSGQQTTYTKSTFTLDKFIPNKPFFSYSGSLPWPPENGLYDYVVFDKEDAITMSTNAYAILTKVIESNDISALKTTDVIPRAEIFYNPKGPISPTAGEIYIDCQPTGDDGEILVPAKLDSGGILDNELLKRMWNFTMVKIIVGFLVMVFLWFLANKILKSIAKNATRVDAGRLGKAALQASTGKIRDAATTAGLNDAPPTGSK